jgi:uncharacterized caspase-like protein
MTRRDDERNHFRFVDLSILVAALLTTVLWMGAFAMPARAQDIAPSSGRKLALVIGNSAYGVAPLRNPTNDARAVATVLARLGFERSDPLFDLSLQELSKAVKEFVSTIRPDDTVLVYFAGHGLQIAGENFLIPVDFFASNVEQVKARSYSATRLASELAASTADVVILILDACRDNPFEGQPRFGSNRSLADSPGLAFMDVDNLGSASKIQATAGMLIQFSTGSGRTAADNSIEPNSLFARHLLEALDTPGLTIEQIFSLVRQRVNDASRGQQVPLTISSIVRPVYLLPPSPAATAAEEAAARVRESEARKAAEEILVEKEREEDDRLWDSVRGSASVELLEIYPKLKPNGRYIDQAKTLIEFHRQQDKPAAPGSDSKAILAPLSVYARAYGAFDIVALRRVFPAVSSEQESAMRDLKATCRTYQVRFDQTKIYQGDRADSVVVVASSEYNCQPHTRQRAPTKMMTDVFRLQLASTGQWLIESLGSFGTP